MQPIQPLLQNVATQEDVKDTCLECSICLCSMHVNPYVETQTWGVLRPCNHKFHAACIKTWMLEQSKQRKQEFDRSHVELKMMNTRLDAVWTELKLYMSKFKVTMDDLQTGRRSPKEIMAHLLKKSTDPTDAPSNDEENDVDDDWSSDSDSDGPIFIPIEPLDHPSTNRPANLSTNLSYAASSPSVPSVVPPRPPSPNLNNKVVLDYLTANQTRKLMQHQAGLMISLLMDQMTDIFAQRQRIHKLIHTQPSCPCCREPISEYAAHQVSSCARKPKHVHVTNWKRWLAHRDVETQLESLRICERKSDLSCNNKAASTNTPPLSYDKRATLWIRYEPPAYAFQSLRKLYGASEAPYKQTDGSAMLCKLFYETALNHFAPDDCDNSQLNELLRCIAKYMSKEVGFDITMCLGEENLVKIRVEATLEDDARSFPLPESLSLVS